MDILYGLGSIRRSLWVCRKFKIKFSWARNMFRRSNICLFRRSNIYDQNSLARNMHSRYKGTDVCLKYWNMFSRSNICLASCMAEVSQTVSLFKIQDSWARTMFCRSKRNI